jgi:pimeloyl-ACP methyl ester carboxylesterase
VFAWRFLFPLLERHFRVTAIDLPGFGKSSKPGDRDYGLDSQVNAVNDTLRGLGIGQAILVGSSMGGVIALWLAKCYPESFSKVITLAPATDPNLVPEVIHRLDGLIPFLRRVVNRHTMRVMLKQVIARHEIIDDEVVDSYLSPFLDEGESVRAFWLATKLIADRRIPTELSGLKAQVLIIYGDRDLRVPRRVIDQLARTLPQASLLTHEGGGHHIMEDEPVWTAETIVKFVSET